jgi:hypothetical protein
MKMNTRFRFGSSRDEAIAFFGTARLVKKSDGRHELIGGTAADHAAAREWCSLFAPAVVFAGIPRCDSAIAFGG